MKKQNYYGNMKRDKIISIRVWVMGSLACLESYYLKFGKTLDKWGVEIWQRYPPVKTNKKNMDCIGERKIA